MFDIASHNLILAQTDAAPSGGGEEILPAVVGETSAADGSIPITGTGGTGGKPAGPFGGSSFLVVIVLMFVVMIVFSFMGQRRDRKKREAMIGAVKKHDKVQTVGGVIGSVVEVKPDTIVLKVDESANTRITFARSSIQQVLTSAPGSALSEDVASI